MIRTITGAITLVVVLSLLVPSSSAATITISDLTDANPIVNLSPDLTGFNVSVSPESVVITGVLPNLTIPPGSTSVILTEPPSDPFGTLSDFVTLTVGATAPSVQVLFESDSFPSFLNDVAKLPTSTPKVVETGLIQDVSQALASGGLTIQVASDLATAEPAEPGAIGLVATGLLGCMGLFQWRRRPRQK